MGLATQPNYRIHSSCQSWRLPALSAWHFIFRISRDWLLITIGISLETVNTAIEETHDAIDTSKRPDIGLAKDVAAARCSP
jgi:diacylglycerol kinase